MRRFSRRSMLKLMGVTAAGYALGVGPRLRAAPGRAQQVAAPRVVHMHVPDATNWDFHTGSFVDHISQDAVSEMVDRGLAHLTGTGSRREAWRALIPDLAEGDRIAIKVNFNNYIDGAEDGAINAVIEPVNALIAGLLERGFAPAHITVYDTTRAWHDGGIPARFIDGCRYPDVRFEAYLDNAGPFSPTARVHFNTPNPAHAVEDLPLSSALAGARYLINMPIVKSHPFTGVTLGFKNHFGSIAHCDELHPYTPGYDYYNLYDPGYSPLVDLNASPYIRDKTILIVGDCLFGNWADPISRPQPWMTFGYRAPNSLFFGRDPLAIECVMTDLLAAETELLPQTDDFLRLAARAGLDVYERSNPWRPGYQHIAYTRVGLSDNLPGGD